MGLTDRNDSAREAEIQKSALRGRCSLGHNQWVNDDSEEILEISKLCGAYVLYESGNQIQICQLTWKAVYTRLQLEMMTQKRER